MGKRSLENRVSELENDADDADDLDIQINGLVETLNR